MIDSTAVRLQEAKELVERRDFVWHQRFELVPGVFTPGRNDVHWLLDLASVPADLSGKTVLDVGTSNGGAAFLLERKGAERVVAVDLSDDEKWGFADLQSFLRSRVEFVRSDVYDLERALGGEKFDLVLCWGVLYHVRHPLLALEALRAVTREHAWIETAVSDGELGPGVSDLAVAQFYRKAFAGDGSNWFVPTVRALADWCVSSGLTPTNVTVWPRERHGRAMVALVRAPGVPEHLAWDRWRDGDTEPEGDEAMPPVRVVDAFPTSS